MRDGLERVMDMKKRLGGRRQIFSAFLPVLAAAALLSGCQRENPAAVTEVSEESQEESRETEQNSEAGTDASVAEGGRRRMGGKYHAGYGYPLLF